VTLTTTASWTGSSPPRVLVSVSSSPASTAVLRVFRVRQNGSQERVLTTGRAVLNGTWSGYDYHAPFNEQIKYFAQTGLEADSALSSVVFIPSDKMWLMHPSDPDLSFPVGAVLKFGNRSRKDTSEGFKVLNSGVTVRRTVGPRGPETGDLSVLLEDQTDVEQVEALLDASSPILLNSPRPEVVKSKWVQPGDWTIGPPAGSYFRSDLRALSFSYEECRVPDEDVAPVWTYADVKVAFPGATYSSIKSTWSSYQNSRLDIRS